MRNTETGPNYILHQLLPGATAGEGATEFSVTELMMIVDSIQNRADHYNRLATQNDNDSNLRKLADQYAEIATRIYLRVNPS